MNILVAGFKGSMGRQTVALIQHEPDFELTAVFDPTVNDLDPTSYGLPATVQVFNQLTAIPAGISDAWVDFTTPTAVFDNVQRAIALGIHPVVGTSGLDEAQQTTLIQQAQAAQIGGLVAPNFGLSAVLLMKFASEAAQYFPDAEVIEMHHQDKQDAPSGTAYATAKAIAAARTTAPAATIPGEARGLAVDGVPVHAVRLPGYVAHEQVLFGAPGEALTIRQDSFDRQSFMSGVALALRKVAGTHDLIVGLEHLL